LLAGKDTKCDGEVCFLGSWWAEEGQIVNINKILLTGDFSEVVFADS
jgi:hypothetical protein